MCIVICLCCYIFPFTDADNYVDEILTKIYVFSSKASQFFIQAGSNIGSISRHDTLLSIRVIFLEKAGVLASSIIL